MNVRKYDGTVLCPDCFDASSYASLTVEACAYCGESGKAQPEAASVSQDGWITRTVTSVDRPGHPTYAVSSTVAEDEASMLAHVAEFSLPGEPEPVTAGFGWHERGHAHYRWTWEQWLPGGVRTTDTVWASRV
jgi:hypothetical protein